MDGRAKLIEYVYYSLNFHRGATYAILCLDPFPEIRNSEDIDQIRNFFEDLVSFGQKLRVIFTVPNKYILRYDPNLIATLNPNQILASFINFLLLNLEAILSLEPHFVACFKGSMEILRTELGFLVTFLGDTGMHLQPTKNLYVDIEAVVKEVGSFFYTFLFTIIVFLYTKKKESNHVMMTMEALVNEVGSFLRSDFFDVPEGTDFEGNKENGKKVEETKNTMTDIKALVHEVTSSLDFFIFTENDQVPETGILDLAISNLLLKFELLKSKINEHCITVLKMPSDMTPKTAVLSLFIVDSVLDDLMNLINNKSDRIVGVQDQIVTLHEELMLLGSSVTHIAVQHEAKHKKLVIQTIDMAYEVEYVINSVPPVWYLTLRLPHLIEKIKIVRMAIQEIKNKIDADGMPEVAKYRGEQVSSQSKGPLILEDIVVGFEEVETEIVEKLVRGTDQLQIISIFGMPGLGKTTLTKKLYNNPHVGCHFDVRTWCVASQTYKKRNMLIEILLSIGHIKRETIMNMEDADLAEKLYKSLKGRRYLVVIDDLWDTNAWNELERYFPREHFGSRILFTTRNKEVGLKTSASVMKELPFLSEDECWELLQRKLFQKDDCPRELRGIGMHIASNCHGLPLVVVSIAGVLANMEKKVHLWCKVASNLTSHISENSDICFQTLELSYKHLPMHLKPCFLYFGAFEEDEEIPVQKLISLWIAEGYIKKEELKCAEDVALKYLVELIDRGLVLVAKRRSDGQVKTCKIHDLLREMCLRIADKKTFLKVLKHNDYDPAQFLSQYHCLIISGASPVNSIPFGQHVRSLLRANLKSLAFISSSFKVLRVLDFLRNWRFHATGIEHLVNLRYLAISCKFPPMESFHKLEFLVVDNRDEVEIPEILLNMVSLRQMYFRGSAYFSESCRQQTTKDESFQINSNLQSISSLAIYDERDEKILRCLLNLRRLKVLCRSSLNYSFDFIYQLESLKLINDENSSFSLISLPLYLKQLTLVGVHMSSKEMEMIERLLNLEVLKFINISFEGRHWDASEVEFPQLKFLKLQNVNLAKWNASRDSFPRLQQLVLGNCTHLKMIPSSFSDIPLLQMIEVYQCTKSVVESAKRIWEEQQDMGNEVLEVKILGLRIEEEEESLSEEQGDEQEQSGSEEQSEEQEESGSEEQ